MFHRRAEDGIAGGRLSWCEGEELRPVPGVVVLVDTGAGRQLRRVAVGVAGGDAHHLTQELGGIRHLEAGAEVGGRVVDLRLVGIDGDHKWLGVEQRLRRVVARGADVETHVVDAGQAVEHTVEGQRAGAGECLVDLRVVLAQVSAQVDIAQIVGRRTVAVEVDGGAAVAGEAVIGDQVALTVEDEHACAAVAGHRVAGDGDVAGLADDDAAAAEVLNRHRAQCAADGVAGEDETVAVGHGAAVEDNRHRRRSAVIAQRSVDPQRCGDGRQRRLQRNGRAGTATVDEVEDHGVGGGGAVGDVKGGAQRTRAAVAEIGHFQVGVGGDGEGHRGRRRGVFAVACGVVEAVHAVEVTVGRVAQVAIFGESELSMCGLGEGDDDERWAVDVGVVGQEQRRRQHGGLVLGGGDGVGHGHRRVVDRLHSDLE